MPMRIEDNRTLTLCGPHAPMGQLLRRFWIPALLSEEVPTPDCPPVRVGLLGEPLVAFRDSNGHVGLLDAHCPHRRAELFFGRNECGGIRCAYHGWKFDRHGKCLDMASEPRDTKLIDEVRATAYPVVEMGGVVWAYLGPDGKQPKMPDLPFSDLRPGQLYVSKCHMRCNYLQALEGSMDTAHLSFLHRSLKTDESQRDVLGVGSFLKYSDVDGTPKFFVTNTDYGLRIAARRDADDKHYYWRISQWLMPLCVLVATAPESVCRGNIFVPIDEENCWWYRIRWQRHRDLTENEIHNFRTDGLDFAKLIPNTYLPRGNRENDYLIDRTVQRTDSFSGISGAQLQDIAVQESQGRIADRSKEFLGTSDMAIAACRSRLLQAAKALSRGVEPPAALKADAYRVQAPAFLLDRSVELDEGVKDLVAELA